MNGEDHKNVWHEDSVEGSSNNNRNGDCTLRIHSLSQPAMDKLKQLVDVEQADFERQTEEIADEKKLLP